MQCITKSDAHLVGNEIKMWCSSVFKLENYLFQNENNRRLYFSWNQHQSTSDILTCIELHCGIIQCVNHRLLHDFFCMYRFLKLESWNKWSLLGWNFSVYYRYHALQIRRVTGEFAPVQGPVSLTSPCQIPLLAIRSQQFLYMPRQHSCRAMFKNL